MFWVVHALVVNGCVNCALFNAVPNVYLQNWKAWVMQKTNYCNNVIMTSVLGKINKQIKLMKEMPPYTKHIILDNIYAKL